MSIPPKKIKGKRIVEKTTVAAQPMEVAGETEPIAPQESESRYRRLFETARDGILILDGDTGRITDANPFLQDILGYARSELIGKALWEIGPVRMPKKATKRTKKQLFVENESLRTWLEEDEEILRAIRSGDWDALILSGSGGEQMITLKASELRYRRLFEATQEGILIVDAATGTIKDINPFLINMSGYRRDEFVENKLWEIDAFKDGGVNLSLSAFETLQENEDIRYEDLPLHAKDGNLIPVEFISNVYLVDDEKVIQCNIRDITKRKQAQDALIRSEALLREQSVRDHLTGLFNRRYMEETLDRELLRASRKQLPLSIIMLDVDDFKRFNDTYGHAAGDAILREVGNLLSGHVRADDIASRYGGDEFVIVMPDSSQEVARERAKLLGEKVCDLHLRFGGQNLELEAFRFSSGVAAFPEDGPTSATILRAVDDALYHAKREGRGRESDAG